MAERSPRAVSAAVDRRQRELHDLLQAMPTDALHEPSELPGWTRLTVVCHLRYGATVNVAMTEDILAGRMTSFYPGGRHVVRNSTLAPADGETEEQVIASMISSGNELCQRWNALSDVQWQTILNEPADNVDLGSISLAELALYRLTEVEVHGSDLAIDAGPWSETFVTEALPARIVRLPQRRSNHRPTDPDVVGTWILSATDREEDYTIELRPSGVTVDRSSTGPRPGAARMEGTSRDLLAFLLGRKDVDALTLSANPALARRFHAAFPPP